MGSEHRNIRTISIIKPIKISYRPLYPPALLFILCGKVREPRVSLQRGDELMDGCDYEVHPPEVWLEVDRLLRALSAQLSAKDSAKIAAEATGLKRNALYERLLELKAD